MISVLSPHPPLPPPFFFCYLIISYPLCDQRSDPSGSALSRVNDKGTQRTAEGGKGVDLICLRDQETSSSGSKGVSSHVDIVGVITWLKLIREA